MNNIDFTFWTSTSLAIIAIILTFIGLYYTRNSYLFTLKQFEKDKNRSEKAIHYYQTYINIPPSYKTNSFLKKIDHDELTESISIPSNFTDFIIRNYPDYFFILISLLKHSWKFFELKIVDNKEILICTSKYLRLKQLGYFLLYFILGMSFTLLIFIYEDKVNSAEIKSTTGSLLILIFGCLLSLIGSITSLIKVTSLTDAISLNKKLIKY